MMKKIILLVIEFLGFCAIGFGLSHLLITNGKKESHNESASEYTEMINEADTNEPVSVLSVSDPIYNAATRKYSFTVEATPGAQTFCLADAEGTPIKGFDRQDGEFSVPATQSGKYHVFVKSASGQESEYVMVKGCSIQISKITKDELQELLNDGNSSAAKSVLDKSIKEGRIANNVKFRWENLDSEEKEIAPESCLDIIGRIQAKKWKSVSVLKVSHDSAGKLNQATISIEY